MDLLPEVRDVLSTIHKAIEHGAFPTAFELAQEAAGWLQQVCVRCDELAHNDHN